ncbi:MAG: hypothetical protein JSS27_17340 [Planctomycetes bacterium]|nr:hypothetical protein [Planctomycetota bacterium]
MSLIAPRFLFRYAVPCRKCEPLWTANGAPLGPEHALPPLGDLDLDRPWGEVRVGWSDEGLAFWVRVEGKKQPPWCRDARPDESDSLRVWVDTRDTKNIHRASRFCHAFIFMPAGSGRALDDPVAEQWLINRAKENPKPIKPGVLQAHREKRVGGYILSAFVPASALTGFDPAEHPRLGFTYAIVDREIGTQSFSCGSEFPYQEDPSLWGTLELAS